MFDSCQNRSLHFCLLALPVPLTLTFPQSTHLSNISTVHRLVLQARNLGAILSLLSFISKFYHFCLPNISKACPFFSNTSTTPEPSTAVSRLGGCSSLQLVCLPPPGPSNSAPTYILQPEQIFQK